METDGLLLFAKHEATVFERETPARLGPKSCTVDLAAQTSHSMDPDMVHVHGLVSFTNESIVSELEW
ncbi:hypothetical protein EYF80_019132 [Liparis tanakae]|uniref:Uncharacterized protein n=1 Tax=Liparis tanakae TaxID=230148 RepID=A0A4Z2HZC1_9TELE|nr:hypothetical protein EYF80_019132 [Liparis tanakae]